VLLAGSVTRRTTKVVSEKALALEGIAKVLKIGLRVNFEADTK
jgi:hypothetical protein